jgi:hypothetical protein
MNPAERRLRSAMPRALAEGEAETARRLLPDLQPLMGSEDVKEGVASFLERREANFAGR